MSDTADHAGPAASLDDVAFDEGGVRITRSALHLGAGHAAIALTDIVFAEETAPRRTAKQILGMILACMVLFVSVPSAFMCPLALMGIPFAAKIFSWALKHRETSFALRVQARGRSPVVVQFDERWLGMRIEKALSQALDAARVRS